MEMMMTLMMTMIAILTKMMNKRLMMTLISIEMMILTMTLMMSTKMNQSSKEYLMMMNFLATTVMGSALGLSLMMTMTRSFGKDYMMNFLILK
uniref:NADH dehydrogenase subunit 4L n=1 Tax=Sinentomon erythranum TaxID=289455 RepID=G3D5N7_9HEXA|nr:NADH dehydrogenase subunit 4L [Sinentomon erythranum]ADN32964.1 NADH dehydrogenase subunit 4L [Sinentomon erythranum]